MIYLTIKEYADLVGQTRQNIEKKIKRKTISYIRRNIRKTFIPIDETEYRKIKFNGLRKTTKETTL